MYYVYIFEDSEQGVTKVGISNNVGYRKSSIECASGRYLDLMYTESYPDKQAASIREQQIHKLLKGYRRRGEWFNLTFGDILQYIDVRGDIIHNPEKDSIDYVALVNYFIDKHWISHPDSPMRNPRTKRGAILYWIAIWDYVDLTSEAIESRLLELENRSYSEWLQESPNRELDIVLARVHQSYCPNCGSP